LTDIRSVLEQCAVPYVGADHKHGREGWLQVDCPWCGGGSGKYHLGISLSTGAAACWRCGKQNTARVIAAISGRNQSKIRESLDGAVMAAAPVRKRGKLVLPAGRAPMVGAHRAYLERRGLDPDEMAARWGVEGIANAAGKWRAFRWRLFIPIHHHGEVVSWTTRNIKKTGQRYLSASEEQESVPHKSILYGADFARHAIIIHEGQIDAWATGPGAVATGGTAYTSAQLRAMARYPVRVVCFDSTPDAQERARVLADDLAPFPGTTHRVELESGKDAAEADPAELKELRDTFL
jgi:hypothetical protein